MINGAHVIIYSRKPEADRAFLRDVLALSSVDVGEGWLIFGLPPSEVAVHPAEKNDNHELYLMCEDIEAFIAAMDEHGIACDPARNMGWGVLSAIRLPGGGKLGVYEPRHSRPPAASPRKTAKQAKTKKAATRGTAAKPAARATAKRAARRR